MKTCTKCLTLKEDTEFSKNGKLYRSQCKQCRAEIMKSTYRKPQYTEPTTIGIKFCTTCKLNLPIDHFTADRSKKDGRAYKCHGCQAMRNKRAKLLLKQSNPKLYKLRQLRIELAAYGLTIEQYGSMVKAQNNTCSICSKPELIQQRLSVDHDHVTGKVRGLLCSLCNRALGGFKDNQTILMAAINYLNRYIGR